MRILRPLAGTLLAALVLNACDGLAAAPTSSPGVRPSSPPSMPASRPPSDPPTNPLSGDVTTYRGDATRSGVMPGPGPRGTRTVAWQYQATAAIGSSPAVLGDTVFVVSQDGVVHALNLLTGGVRWTVSFKATVGSASLGQDAAAMNCTSFSRKSLGPKIVSMASDPPG